MDVMMPRIDGYETPFEAVSTEKPPCMSMIFSSTTILGPFVDHTNLLGIEKERLPWTHGLHPLNIAGQIQFEDLV